MNLIIALAFSADNAPMAERLLDFMWKQSGQQHGHVLLAPAPDAHAEIRQRIKISAEMAFKGVSELEIRPLTDQTAPKPAHINSTFRQVANHVQDCFSWPFLFLEPDCVPMHSAALHELWDEYHSQPRPFFGTQMKTMTTANEEQLFMARVGIYPNNTFNLLFIKPELVKMKFEILAGEIVIPRFTPTKLIQQTKIVNESDLGKVRSDAILVHGDKNGHLLRKLEREAAPKVKVLEPTPLKIIVPENPDPSNFGPVEISRYDPPILVAPKKRGRPPKVKPETTVLNGH